MVIQFCCIPDDGHAHAEVLYYNTYNPWESTLRIDGSRTVYPFDVYKGGQEEPFSPDLQAGGGFQQGLASPAYVQDSGNLSVGGMAGGTSLLLWTQWDTGIGERITLTQQGSTALYPTNSTSGQTWSPYTVNSSIPPEDYLLGP